MTMHIGVNIYVIILGSTLKYQYSNRLGFSSLIAYGTHLLGTYRVCLFSME